MDLTNKKNELDATWQIILQVRCTCGDSYENHGCEEDFTQPCDKCECKDFTIPTCEHGVAINQDGETFTCPFCE